MRCGGWGGFFRLYRFCLKDHRMIFFDGNRRRRGRIAAQIPGAINNLLVNIADHDLQIEIVHGLAADVLQLLKVLAQDFERPGLRSMEARR